MYTPSQVKHILRNYHNMKSAAEITAQTYDEIRVSTSRTSTREDVIVLYLDIEKVLPTLTIRQKQWASLYMQGYTIIEIASKTNCAASTVSKGINRLCNNLSRKANFSRVSVRSS